MTCGLSRRLSKLEARDGSHPTFPEEIRIVGVNPDGSIECASIRNLRNGGECSLERFENESSDDFQKRVELASNCLKEGDLYGLRETIGPEGKISGLRDA